MNLLEFTWSFLFIEYWTIETLSNWIVSPGYSQLSKLKFSAVETVRPDSKLQCSCTSLLNGLWVWNKEMKVERPVLSCVFRPWFISKSCLLDLRLFPIKLVIASCMAPHLWAVLAHKTRIDSVNPHPLVMPALLFRDMIIIYSIIKSDHEPDQNVFVRCMVW